MMSKPSGARGLRPSSRKPCYGPEDPRARGCGPVQSLCVVWCELLALFSVQRGGARVHDSPWCCVLPGRRHSGFLTVPPCPPAHLPRISAPPAAPLEHLLSPHESHKDCGTCPHPSLRPAASLQHVLVSAHLCPARSPVSRSCGGRWGGAGPEPTGAFFQGAPGPRRDVLPVG